MFLCVSDRVHRVYIQKSSGESGGACIALLLLQARACYSPPVSKHRHVTLPPVSKHRHITLPPVSNLNVRQMCSRSFHNTRSNSAPRSSSLHASSMLSPAMECNCARRSLLCTKLCNLFSVSTLLVGRQCLMGQHERVGQHVRVGRQCLVGQHVRVGQQVRVVLYCCESAKGQW